MFVVFRRACAPADEPGATVTRDARAAALRDRRILDVPKLVDLCAIYGPDNPAAVALLARDAATLVPNLDRALADAGARLASGLETTADRLAAAAFEDGALDDDARDDALRYFHDVAVSLAALVRAHPPFAEALLRGGAEAEDVEPGRFGDEKNHRRDRKGKAVMVSEDADGSNVNPTLDPSARGIDPRHAAPGALLEAIDRAAHETTPLLSGVGDGGAVVAAAADATTRARSTRRDASSRIRRGWTSIFARVRILTRLRVSLLGPPGLGRDRTRRWRRPYRGFARFSRTTATGF